jgi:hypothetical protein
MNGFAFFYISEETEAVIDKEAGLYRAADQKPFFVPPLVAHFW